MATATKVQLAAGEELTVKANDASAAAGTSQAAKPAAQAAAPAAPAQATRPANIMTLTASGAIPAEVEERGIEVARSMSQGLLEAHRAMLAGATIQDVSVGQGLVWELASAGPYSLNIPLQPYPIHVPSRVIAAGQWAMMIGISYTKSPVTTFAFQGKEFDARFTTVNLTEVTKGPGAGLVGLFPNIPFVIFVLFFKPALTAGNDQELYDINFTIDLETDTPGPRVPGAGFSNWNFDPDTTAAIPNPISLPGTGPHWQEGISGRYMVNDPKN